MEEAVRFPFEADVKADKPMPSGMSLSDQSAYYRLSQLFAGWKAKLYTKEEAAAEKKAIYADWKKAKMEETLLRMLNGQREHFKRYAAMIRATEALKARIRKESKDKLALLLCDVLDGLGDDVRMEGIRWGG